MIVPMVEVGDDEEVDTAGLSFNTVSDNGTTSYNIICDGCVTLILCFLSNSYNCCNRIESNLESYVPIDVWRDEGDEGRVNNPRKEEGEDDDDADGDAVDDNDVGDSFALLLLLSVFAADMEFQ